MTEEMDLRQAWEDFRIQRRRGFEIEEDKPVPARERITFSYYVTRPSTFFGMLTFVAVLGMSLALIVGLELIKVPYAPWIGVGLSLCSGALVAGRAAYELADDWRDMQWKYERRVYPQELKREAEKRGRILEGTGPNTYNVTRCTWVPNWKERLARRCFNQYGHWVATNNVSRRLFEKKDRDPQNLFDNLTGMYDAAKKDLQDKGILDVNGMFTERGKQELREALRIYQDDANHFPTPDYNGPVVA